jgi:hypothetical protein
MAPRAFQSPADVLRRLGKLGPYVDHRTEAGETEPEPTAEAAAPAPRVDAAAVRAWAKGEGIPLRPKGPLPTDVIEQFRAAQAAEVNA